VTNAPLRAAVAQCIGLRDPSRLRLLQCASAAATGSLVLQAWLHGGNHPVLVLKTPRNPQLHHSLGREWDALRTLRADPGLARLLPAAVARLDIDGIEYFAYEGMPGRTLVSLFRDRVFATRDWAIARYAAAALVAALTLHQTDSQAVPAEAVAEDLLADVAWLETVVRALPADLSRRVATSATAIAAHGGTLPCGRVHGDFSPGNLMAGARLRHGVTSLIDWEHTEPQRPQSLDVFRFMSACALMGRRGDERRAAIRRAGEPANPMIGCLLQPWLVRMGVSDAAGWLEPPTLRALWWHYWMHAARRQQERLAMPERGVSAASLLQGLATATSTP
jgi:hypothetical protein